VEQQTALMTVVVVLLGITILLTVTDYAVVVLVQHHAVHVIQLQLHVLVIVILVVMGHVMKNVGKHAKRARRTVEVADLSVLLSAKNAHALLLQVALAQEHAQGKTAQHTQKVVIWHLALLAGRLKQELVLQLQANVALEHRLLQNTSAMARAHA